MKQTKIENNVFIVARKTVRGKELDYYIQLPDKEEHYMFTRAYSAKCYEVCKAGIPINRVLHVRCRNQALMNMANHLKFMMPYFVEYFELGTVA